MNPRIGLALVLCLASCKHYFIVDGTEVTRFDHKQAVETPETRAAKLMAGLLKDDSALRALSGRVLFVNGYAYQTGYAGDESCRETSNCWVLKDLLKRSGYTVVDDPAVEHDVELRVREVWLGDGAGENKEARSLEEYASIPGPCANEVLGFKSVFGSTTLLSIHTADAPAGERRTFKATACATLDQMSSDNDEFRKAPGGGGPFRLSQLKTVYLLAQLASDGAPLLARLGSSPGPLFTGLLSRLVDRLDGSTVEEDVQVAFEVGVQKAAKERIAAERAAKRARSDGASTASNDSGAVGLALTNAALAFGSLLASGGKRPVGNPLAPGGTAAAPGASKPAGPNCNSVVKNHTGDPQFDSFCALAGCHRAMNRATEANQTCRALTGLSGADLSKCMYCR